MFERHGPHGCGPSATRRWTIRNVPSGDEAGPGDTPAVADPGADASALADLPLTIHQVEMVAGVTKPTLRYWEKIFHDFLDPHRTSGNQRIYSMDDVRRILRIKRLLKIEMYTISGARRQLGLEQSGEPGKGES